MHGKSLTGVLFCACFQAKLWSFWLYRLMFDWSACICARWLWNAANSAMVITGQYVSVMSLNAAFACYYIFSSHKVRDAGDWVHGGGIAPLPFQMRGDGGGGALLKQYHRQFHVFFYQDRIETNLLLLFASRKFRMVFYYFCFYFWGQHCCWTETNILVTICLFLITFHCPQLFYCPPALPLFRRPCLKWFVQNSKVCALSLTTSVVMVDWVQKNQCALVKRNIVFIRL